MTIPVKSGIAFAACWASIAWADIDLQILDQSGQPLPEAVVLLRSESLKQPAEPMAPVEMAQVDREFVPGVVVVTQGTPVEFPNRDDVRHHVYSFSPAKTFELKLYIGKPKAPVVFDQAGVVELGCNIHDTMIGWILVSDTPIYGRTDSEGQVTLKTDAEGPYTVAIWHRSFAYGEPFYQHPLATNGSTTVQQIVVPAQAKVAP